MAGQKGRGGTAGVFPVSLAGTGNGPCLPAPGGLCLDLLPDLHLPGTASVDGGGAARLSVPVPPGLPPIEVSVQAAIRRGVPGRGTGNSKPVSRAITGS
jgi:hypothetical protein